MARVLGGWGRCGKEICNKSHHACKYFLSFSFFLFICSLEALHDAGMQLVADGSWAVS